VRAFVTGATGFIGGHVARKLRERGDEVVALVRSPSKAGALRDLGCELLEGDLSSPDAIRRGVEGVDAVFHIGAIYKVGIPKSEHESMWEANVRGTERVFDAAIDAGVARIVFVSTVAVFGDTRGQVVDERYRRPAGGFLSCYDETKFRAHEIAEERIAQGAPIVIVQPGGVYGPNDHSEIGDIIKRTARGRMPAKMFADTGFMFCHVEDIAEGILLAHDKGRVGEAYVLAGEQLTAGELMDRVARLAGRRRPLVTLPGVLAKAGVPVWPVLGPLLGFPPNLPEMIRSSDGVTYWATDEKARHELGFAPRDLDTGLRETIASIR
jgi:nucleoside-diphosphate-sugar epimerase